MNDLIKENPQFIGYPVLIGLLIFGFLSNDSPKVKPNSNSKVSNQLNVIESHLTNENQITERTARSLAENYIENHKKLHSHMGLQLLNSSPDNGAFYFTTGVCFGRSPTDCSMESVGIVTFDHGKSWEFEFLNN